VTSSYTVKPAEGRVCNDQDGIRVPPEGKTFDGDVTPWFIRREGDGDCVIERHTAAKPPKK